MGMFDDIIDKIPANDGDNQDPAPEGAEDDTSTEPQGEEKKRMHEYSDEFVRVYGPRKE